MDRQGQPSLSRSFVHSPRSRRSAPARTCLLDFHGYAPAGVRGPPRRDAAVPPYRPSPDESCGGRTSKRSCRAHLASYARTGPRGQLHELALHALEATFFDRDALVKIWTSCAGTAGGVRRPSGRRGERVSRTRARQRPVLGLELALDRARRPRARGRAWRGRGWPSRSCAAARPPGGTAGCSAQLVNTPPSYSARHSSAAFQSSPTSTGTIGVVIVALGASAPRAGAHGLAGERAVAERGSARRRGSARSRAPRPAAPGPRRERMMRSAASAAPSAAGTAEAVNRNGARGDAQVLDHLRRARDEAAAGGERLREGAHAQIDAVLHARAARDAPAPRAPSTPAPCASSTIRRAP